MGNNSDTIDNIPYTNISTLRKGVAYTLNVQTSAENYPPASILPETY